MSELGRNSILSMASSQFLIFLSFSCLYHFREAYCFLAMAQSPETCTFYHSMELVNSRCFHYRVGGQRLRPGSASNGDVNQDRSVCSWPLLSPFVGVKAESPSCGCSTSCWERDCSFSREPVVLIIYNVLPFLPDVTGSFSSIAWFQKFSVCHISQNRQWKSICQVTVSHSFGRVNHRVFSM